jgi:hypothetical protein
MRTHLRGRIVAVAVVVPLLAGTTACENDKKKAEQAANSACPSSISNTASDSLPSDVPTPDGADTPYQSFSQGQTKVWYFAVDGGPDNLGDLRDSYDETLKSNGYDIEGTDQEAGAEAESEFKGPHTGTTNFRPLCKGKVTLRLKLES